MECQINGNQVSKGLCFKSMIFCLQVLLYYIIVISRVNEISMHAIPYSDPSLCSLIVFYDYFDERERGEERERERGRERERERIGRLKEINGEKDNGKYVCTFTTLSHENVMRKMWSVPN